MVSNKKRVFDLWLSKLNENTQGVTFGGNCMFQFNRAGTYDFEIVSLNDDALDYTKTEYVPVVDVQEIEVPFVEKNKRTDFEREFYIAIKVDRTRDALTNKMVIEFDDTDSRYQALLETIENIRDNLTFIDGDYKYTFKVRQPNKSGVFKWNSNHYLILSVSMNLTSLEQGFFGNETKAYFGLKSDVSFAQTSDYELDIMEFTEIVGKTTRANSNTQDDEETFKTIKRSWEASITVNFNGNVADLLLYKELTAQSNLDETYQIYVTNANLNTQTSDDYDYTFDVILTSANITYKNNVVNQITFKLQRV